MVVQTATSVNGFTDDQSVLLVNGVKRTTPTRWPDALVADTAVLVAAPAALNVAGVGDLAAMFTAPADWLLATRLDMGGSYSPAIVDMVRRHGQSVLDAAPRLAKGDPDAAAHIAGVLALSGISMGVAGTTAPASGMEHTVSHLIEMAMNARGTDAAFHGAQVGVCTIAAAHLWWRVAERMRSGALELRFPDDGEMHDRVGAAFASLDPSGEMAAECWRLYSRKLSRWTGMRAGLESTDWEGVAASVADLLIEPQRLTAALSDAGAPARFSQLDPPVDRDLARWALAHCHLMRDRYTVADLAFLAGMWDEAAVDTVLSEVGF